MLTAANIPFTVRVADIDETPRSGEDPRLYVLRMAEGKARAISGGETILAADTTVVANNIILGKPENAADAARMLNALAGSRHEVLTAICLMRNGAVLALEAESTAVWFAPMSEPEIQDYIASGEPMDKAGAYAIQGIASRWIARIEGSYSNVVGLPIELVYSRLSAHANR